MKSVSRKKLLKQIDEARKEFVRKRDTDFSGYATCISCGIMGENYQVGHYYSRVHDFNTLLGGEARNVNLQCVTCNSYKRGNPRGYAVGLLRKYGKDVIMELDKKKTTKKYWKMKDLKELLEFFKNGK